MRYIKRSIVVCLFCLLAIMLPCNVAMARAGGGGGGGDGGGGGGGTGGGYYSNSRSSSSPISQIFGYIVFAVVASGGAIIFTARIYIKSQKSKKAMKSLARSDASWNLKDFNARIEEIFYSVQNAWMERNQDLAKNYMSGSLYDEYNTKSEWMKVRHEKNILKNIRLIDAMPIEVEDNVGNDNDRMWVFIKAKMIDFTINDITMEFVSGSKVPRSFVEYWKLIKENGNWVLDEIRQKNELNLNEI